LPIYYWQHISSTICQYSLPIFCQLLAGIIRKPASLLSYVFSESFWRIFKILARNTPDMLHTIYGGMEYPHILTWVLVFYCVLGFHATYWQWGCIVF
jgi:hypothetical protein